MKKFIPRTVFVTIHDAKIEATPCKREHQEYFDARVPGSVLQQVRAGAATRPGSNRMIRPLLALLAGKPRVHRLTFSCSDPTLWTTDIGVSCACKQKRK